MANDTAITDTHYETSRRSQRCVLSCRGNTQHVLSPRYSSNTDQQQEEHYQATDQQHNTFHRRHVSARYVQVLTDSNFMAVPCLSESSLDHRASQQYDDISNRL